MEVIELHEKGKSERKLADIFSCGKTQINSILKEKNAIRKEWEDFKFRGVKRLRTEKFPDINEALLEWFKTARTKNIPISGALMQEKALEIADAIGVKDFQASNGWLEKFRTRNNIVFRALCGEAADVDDSVCEDWVTRLPLLLAGYADQDIFNMDETGLFFRALPNKSMVLRSEDSKGGKQAKERMTIAFCASATGEKLKPLMIWRSKNPRCFKGKNMNRLGIHWKANKKSWMTSSIFEEWLMDFDKKMKREGRNVLLILDNATCHKHEATLKNVKLLFLPPNVTSKLQPLDHGVIKWFKVEYRRQVLRCIIARMEDCHSATELAKTITVADAVEWAKRAWNAVSKDLIFKCFASCSLTNSEFEKQIRPRNSLDNCHLEEIEELTQLAGIEFEPQSMECEENLECFDALSDNWEERVMQDAISAQGKWAF